MDRFWTVGPNWPHNGEIDILEGVHEQTNNGMTLHTGPGCQIGQDTSQFAGSLHTGNCDVAAEGQPANTGCSIEHPSTQSYGAGLNAIGGGVYATQWTADAISIYYFPRDSVPADVLGDSPNPSGWGKPAAKFNGGCDIAQTFKQQQIVFDTTFCGQWAGSQGVWDSSSCSRKASTCVDFVRDNPQAFSEAYWTINALKVYQDNGQGFDSPARSYPSKAPSAPVVSSQYAVPTQDPAASAPISTASYDNAPDATYTEDAAAPAAPTSPAAAEPPAQAPTDADGMSGFQWPEDGTDQQDDSGASDDSSSPDQSPDSRKVRMARHMREHRQKLTRHNTRV